MASEDDERDERRDDALRPSPGQCAPDAAPRSAPARGTAGDDVPGDGFTPDAGFAALDLERRRWSSTDSPLRLGRRLRRRA